MYCTEVKLIFEPNMKNYVWLAYLALVRHCLEYCCVVWTFHASKNVSLIESVHHRAIWWIKSCFTIYCKSFEVEKFCGFRGSIGRCKTFTVKHFHSVLKMVGHGPGSSLKNSCDLLSTLGKVSGIKQLSQNY